MTDVSIGDLNPAPNPPCPVCGGETVLTEMHKAVAKVTDVFRCKRCGVEYPVVRKSDS
jgi:predicted RNA-binding Zn-ribbon protein involved in translation (DUF1610 family)